MRGGFVSQKVCERHKWLLVMAFELIVTSQWPPNSFPNDTSPSVDSEPGFGHHLKRCQPFSTGPFLDGPEPRRNLLDIVHASIEPRPHGQLSGSFRSFATS
jgi:hypothetical protein